MIRFKFTKVTLLKAHVAATFLTAFGTVAFTVLAITLSGYFVRRDSYGFSYGMSVSEKCAAMAATCGVLAVILGALFLVWDNYGFPEKETR